jgi:predicted nucleotidyltransferase
MSVRGEAHRAAIRVVVRTFGAGAGHFVFVGGCVLGLYARPVGAALRVTKDVDCISTVLPWSRQEQLLAEMCSREVLVPDIDLQCRYHIVGSDVAVDVLSPDGLNVGGVNPWFSRAAQRAGTYDAGDGCIVKAVTPPYFLTTKLVAFASRGEDAQSSADAEDIVALAVEVPDLVAQVDAEQLRQDVAALWTRALDKHDLDANDLPDLVAWHLDRQDAEHEARVVEAIVKLAAG